MNLLFKIKSLFRRKPSQDRQVMENLIISQQISDAHLVALARLMFIKPSTWVREAQNTKGNAEYLLEMIKEKKGKK